MSNRISAVEGAIARGAQAVSGAHIDISDSTRRVTAELDELGAHWTGQAAGSYAQLVGEWTQGAHKVNSLLVHLEQALRATERDQQESEQAHQTTISGLSALLGGQ